MAMPGLHRVGGEEDLGHEQDPVAEVDADDPHALDEGVVEDLVRAPAAAEEDVRALDDLRRHAVVEVVVHLLDELVVGQRREVEVLVRVRHAHAPFCCGDVAPVALRALDCSTSRNGAV